MSSYSYLNNTCVSRCFFVSHNCRYNEKGITYIDRERLQTTTDIVDEGALMWESALFFLVSRFDTDEHIVTYSTSIHGRSLRASKMDAFFELENEERTVAEFEV